MAQFALELYIFGNEDFLQHTHALLQILHLLRFQHLDALLQCL
jgi:hypothetical protein